MRAKSAEKMRRAMWIARRVFSVLILDFPRFVRMFAANYRAIRAIRAKLIREAAEDPHVYRAAEAQAFNNAIISLGRDPAKEWLLTPFQKWSRNLFSFSATKFPRRGDVAPSRSVAE